MATAEVKTTFERRKVERYEEVATKSYVIELSEDEAETLRFVLGRVGGPAESTPREHTEAVFEALAKAGVRWVDDPGAARNHIMFQRHFRNGAKSL